jgi:hypothetical protein
VQVEDVARVGFTARRAAQQQGHLAVGHGLLGQIVIDDQGVHAVVAEELAHGGAGERSQELQRGRLRGRGGDDDGVVQGAALFERLDDLGDGRALLTDGDVDAVELFAFRRRSGVGRLLVQDGVDGDGGLADLTVTNDQLALAAADGDQGVDGLQAGLHRLVHRLAGDDARRLDVDAATLGEGDRALAVDRLAQRVDDAAQQALADRNVHDLAEAADFVAFSDGGVGAEDNRADVVALEVQGHALHAGLRELDHLAGLDVVQTVDAGDAVADRQHLADVGHVRFNAEGGDLRLEDGRNLGGADVHGLALWLSSSGAAERPGWDGAYARHSLNGVVKPA